jgi:hypothetical protein
VTSKAVVLQAIRQKCLDCCVYQPTEVRECTVYTCGLWPYRLGMDPHPSQTRGFAKSPVYAADFGQGGQTASAGADPTDLVAIDG